MAAPWTPLGRLNAKLTIQSIDTARTAEGETTDTAVPLITAWARIEPLSGREHWLADAQQDLVTHRLRIHYHPDVTVKMQAVWQGRVFRFVSVVNVDQSNRELEILALEVAP